MFNPKRIAAFFGRFLLLAVPFILGILFLGALVDWTRATSEDVWRDGTFWVRLLTGLIPPIAVSLSVFWLAGRFVRDVYKLDNARAGINFLLRCRFGMSGFKPWMQVREGRITMGDEPILTRLGGPGHLVLYHDSAVVLERAGKLTRVVGSGFPRLEPFERIYDIVDLRPQRRVYTVKAMTKDGISISWDAEIHYQIDNGGQEATQENPYPFSTDAVFKAATCRWIFVGKSTKMDWEGRVVISETEGALRTILARRHLDEMIGVREADGEVVRQAIERELKMRLDEAVPKLGARILKVKLDNLVVDDEITQQWVTHWKAVWTRWSTERLADGEAERLYLYETAKASAQMSLLIKIASAFEGLAASELVSSEIVLMRLFSVLDRADFSAASRIFFPNEALKALEGMRTMLVPLPEYEVRLFADPARIPVRNGSSAIKAYVHDRGKNQPAPKGTAVRFQTTLGDISPESVAVDGGEVQAMLRAGAVAGVAAVTATVGSVSSQTPVTIVPGPTHNIVLWEDREPSVRNGSVSIVASLTDRFGNCVADGVEVQFIASGGTPTPDEATTANGIARTEIKPDPGLTTLQIVATSEGRSATPLIIKIV